VDRRRTGRGWEVNRERVKEAVMSRCLWGVMGRGPDRRRPTRMCRHELVHQPCRGAVCVSVPIRLCVRVSVSVSVSVFASDEGVPSRTGVLN
jgi:hypothetical protein